MSYCPASLLSCDSKNSLKKKYIRATLRILYCENYFSRRLWTTTRILIKPFFTKGKREREREKLRVVDPWLDFIRGVKLSLKGATWKTSEIFIWRDDFGNEMISDGNFHDNFLRSGLFERIPVGVARERFRAEMPVEGNSSGGARIESSLRQLHRDQCLVAAGHFSKFDEIKSLGDHRGDNSSLRTQNPGVSNIFTRGNN